MATPPAIGPSRRPWDDGDDKAVTAIDFSKRPKFEKSTHPECFPVDKNKFLTKVKPLELENYKTQEKTVATGASC